MSPTPPHPPSSISLFEIWERKVIFFFFWQESRIYWWAWVRRGQCQSSHEWEPFVQETTTRDVFDPTAIRDEPLFCCHVFIFICIKLSKSPVLGDVDLLVAREHELGPELGLSHVLLVLQLGVDGYYDLANVDPSHCALGLSKGTVHTCLESRLGTASRHECPLERAVSKVP